MDNSPNIVDWATLILSALAFYYLVRTFQEQAKINKATLFKHIREIRPHFDVDYNGTSHLWHIKVFNAIAINVIIKRYQQDGSLTVEFEYDSFYPKDIHYLNSTAPSLDYNSGAPFLQIKYSDEEGRTYEQIVIGDEEGLYVMHPKLIADIV